MNRYSISNMNRCNYSNINENNEIRELELRV